MNRGDIQGRRAPRRLAALITRRWGRNWFGEPNYRLVWAPARWERSGGVWTDWDTAAVATADRGKPGAHPLRRQAEMRWVRKYPGEQCWLLERWTPAASYGTPEQWYRPASEGGTLLPCGITALGEYPHWGDYEDLGARLYWYPTERHIEAAIGAAERGLAAAPQTVAGRARRRTWLAEQRQQQRDEEYDRLAADVFDDAAPAFGGAPLVGYGGSRRPALVEMAERIGIRQHPL